MRKGGEDLSFSRKTESMGKFDLLHFACKIAVFGSDGRQEKK